MPSTKTPATRPRTNQMANRPFFPDSLDIVSSVKTAGQRQQDYGKTVNNLGIECLVSHTGNWRENFVAKR